MRVIGGSARGVPLKGPASAATRATSDKVRGVIFDVLAAAMPEARVLDLYAGTGALGVEALSRGGASCLFVEKARTACQVIEANLRATRLSADGLIWCLPVAVALERLERAATGDTTAPLGSTFAPPYDVIMLDPPYDSPEIVGTVERIASSPLVADGGYVVLEHSKRLAPPSSCGALSLRRARLYGDTGVTIWQRAVATDGTVMY